MPIGPSARRAAIAERSRRARNRHGSIARDQCRRPDLVQAAGLGQQSFPRRDLEDIRALLRAQHGRLNMVEVREYFTMFDRTEMPDGLLAEIADERH